MLNTDKKMLLKSVLFILMILLCLLTVNFLPVQDYIKPEYLAELKSQYGEHLICFTGIFMLGGLVLIAAGFPRTIFCIMTGMLYNFWLGLLMGQIVALGGAYATYVLSRKLNRPFFTNKISRYLPVVDKFSRLNPVIFMVLLRQAPIPGLATNALSGTTNIDSKSFLLGSFIGFLPQSVIFCLFGNSINQHFVLQITIACVLLMIMLLGVKFYITKKFSIKPPNGFSSP